MRPTPGDPGGAGGPRARASPRPGLRTLRAPVSEHRAALRLPCRRARLYPQAEPGSARPGCRVGFSRDRSFGHFPRDPCDLAVGLVSLSSSLERAFVPAVVSSDSRDCPVAEGPPNVSEEGRAVPSQERGMTSWGWDLGSVAGYSFCPSPVTRVTSCFALQRWFVEPLPST